MASGLLMLFLCVMLNNSSLYATAQRSLTCAHKPCMACHFCLQLIATPSKLRLAHKAFTRPHNRAGQTFEVVCTLLITLDAHMMMLTHDDADTCSNNERNDLGAGVSGSPAQPRQGEDEQTPRQAQQEGAHVQHHPWEPPNSVCLHSHTCTFASQLCM